MAHARQYVSNRLLPDPLPEEPVSILRSWMLEAAEKNAMVNPDAMTLATADESGRPSARIVLAKEIDPARGAVVFFTNRESHKGRELRVNPRAALVFFWDALHLQGRVEGPVLPVTDAESDEYWKSRWVISRVSAWVSQQSRPLGSREEILRKVEEAAVRFGVPADGSSDADIPRPHNWGGYRVWAERVELWIGQPGRVHDRGLWARTLHREGGGYRGGQWTSTRLQP